MALLLPQLGVWVRACSFPWLSSAQCMAGLLPAQSSPSPSEGQLRYSQMTNRAAQTSGYRLRCKYKFLFMGLGRVPKYNFNSVFYISPFFFPILLRYKFHFIYLEGREMEGERQKVLLSTDAFPKGPRRAREPAQVSQARDEAPNPWTIPPASRLPVGKQDWRQSRDLNLNTQIGDVGVPSSMVTDRPNTHFILQKIFFDWQIKRWLSNKNCVYSEYTT